MKNAIFFMVGAAVMLVAAVACFAGFGALAEPILFHLSRDFENGSVGSVVLIGLRAIGIDYYRLHIALAKFFFVAQFAAVIPVVLKEYPKDFRTLVRSCIFLLLPFMALGLIFSPQWIVWLTPVVLLVADRTELKLLAALDIVVFLQFPVLFGINPFSTYYLLFTVIRTGLFAALWWRNFCAVSLAHATLPHKGPQTESSHQKS